MWRLLAVTVVLALLAGCSIAGVRSGIGLDDPWECTPIDPLWQELPANPCFRAVLSAENQITLQWRVINSQREVYILDDFGMTYEDVGFKPASCPTDTCSASVVVTEGGFQRWLLQVTHPGGSTVYVPASINVPAPFPLVEVTGASFVDMLAPASQSIAWAADPRNAAWYETTRYAWVEMLFPGSYWWGEKRYARSGPKARFDIPQSQLEMTPNNAVLGIVYTLRDCHLVAATNSKFCSQSTSVGFNLGSDRFLDANPLYADANRDLQIFFTNQSGDERRLQSTTLISQQQAHTAVVTSGNSYTIAANLLTPGNHTIELQSCISQTNTCSPSAKLLILVDSPVTWELNREYTNDFDPAITYTEFGTGEPLDISYDNEGGIWLSNEFANSIEHVSATGTVESITLPLARNPARKHNLLQPAQPFAMPVAANHAQPSSISALMERVTHAGSKIWFTQGGGDWGTLEYDESLVNNHSRAISYDALLADSLATPYDDRLCAYNIPADTPDGMGNNVVIGLAAAKDRIWVAESRGLFGKEPSAISSFIPNPDSCDNLLNFTDPKALASQSLQYCSPGKTPEQDGCVEKYLFDKLPPGLRVVHLATDPIDDSIWFTDGGGGYLGNLNPDRDNAIKIYPLPDSHPGMLLGGFPWSLRVDNSAVYFTEYSTRSILRFDKPTATFDEIKIPVATAQVALHSSDIDAATDRLWFTLANEAPVPLDRAASTIGYIDLASWREHVADPKSNTRISGVIYAGLEKIAAAPDLQDKHQAFRGIAVDPASGKIALATAVRRQITELTPKAGTWP